MYEKNEPNSHGSSTEMLHLKGRGAQQSNNPNSPTMCRMPKIVEAMYTAGMDVTNVWCKAHCPFREDCEWMKQRQDAQYYNALVGSHEFLYSQLPNNVHYDFLFFDEAVRGLMQILQIGVPIRGLGTGLTLAGTKGFLAPLHIDSSELEENCSSDSQRKALEQLYTIRDTIVDCLRKSARQGGLRQLLRISGLRRSHIRHCYKYLRDRVTTDDITAASVIAKHYNETGSVDKMTARSTDYLTNNYTPPPNKAIANVLELVYRELDPALEHSECTSLRFANHTTTNSDIEVIMGAFWRKPNIPNRAGVIHADGTASEDIARETFGERTVHKVINVDRNIHVTLVTDSGCTKSALSPSGKGRDTRFTDASHHKLKSLCRMITQKQITNVITHKNTIEYMDYEHQLPAATKAVELKSWYNNNRGRNHLEGEDNILVLGRPLPSVYEVEALARAVALNRKQQFTSIDSVATKESEKGRWLVEYVRTELRDGSVALLPHYTHPDPIAVEILDLLCVYELEQCVDRLRGIRWEGSPIRVYWIATNCSPKTIPVDEVTSYTSFMAQSRNRLQTLLETNSAVPLDSSKCYELVDYLLSAHAEYDFNTIRSAPNSYSELRGFYKTFPTSAAELPAFRDTHRTSVFRKIERDLSQIKEIYAPTDDEGYTVGTKIRHFFPDNKVNAREVGIVANDTQELGKAINVWIFKFKVQDTPNSPVKALMVLAQGPNMDIALRSAKFCLTQRKVPFSYTSLA